MSGGVDTVIGTTLAIVGWLAPRWVAGARRVSLATLLDAAPTAFTFGVLFLAAGRPVFAGAVVLALGVGFAFADRTLRHVLREPVMFTALSELPQVFTHPHLYLPFAGTGLVAGGACAAVLAGVVLLLIEPAAMRPYPLAAILVLGVAGALMWRLGREPWLSAAAHALGRFAPSGEPFADAARLGPAAMLIVHGIIARAERPGRRARLTALVIVGDLTPARPIVLVQCESFFDARRAFPELPRDMLAGFDATCAGGNHGRLTVPAWGANTTRAEFAVLTGLDDAALGYDRFNPYHAMARGRIASHVWWLRAAGYKTVCLHPFDRRFFRRDLAMPALGFEAFLGRDMLGGGRRPPYMRDPELAEWALRALDAAGRRSFIFAITMGNHGPWGGDADGLEGYLAGLRRSDEMIQILIDGLARRGDGAMLGFYGDHLPSLPRVFAQHNFGDWHSDYAIWSADGVAGRRDLAAHELGRWLLEAAAAATRDDIVATVRRA